jgi:hypothetical protein
MSCVVDLDCPTNLVCYSSASWFLANRDLYPSSACMCTTWYGWTGPSCTDLGGSSQYFFMSAMPGLLGVGFALEFGMSARHVALLLFRTPDLLKSPLKRAQVASALITATQTTLGSAFLLCHEFILVATQFSPAAADRPNAFSAGEKSSGLSATARILFLLGAVCALLGIVTVALVWVDLALRSEHLQHKSSVSRLSQFIVVYEVLVMLVCFGNLIFGDPDFVAVVFYPFVLFTAMLYLYGFVKMRQLLGHKPSLQGNQASDIQAKYRQVLAHIYLCTVLVEAFLFMFFVLSIAYTVLSLRGWKQVPPGSVLPMSWLTMLSELMLQGIMAVVIYSTHRSVQRFTASKEGLSSKSVHAVNNAATGSGTGSHASLTTAVMSAGSAPLVSQAA